jgi:hypothetical protein
MLVWEGSGGAAYDPAADSWRMLPPAPYALNQAQGIWTGREMIVYGSLLDRNNHSERPTASGLAYDLERNQWREIAPFELSPQASMVVWSGRKMIGWDYELRAGAYDPDSDRWRRLPSLPLQFSECYPDGALAGERFVLAWHCGQAAILGLAEEEWRELPRSPSSVAGRAVAAGEAVLFAGAWPPGSRIPLWAYRAGPLGAAAFVPRAEGRGDRDFLPLTFLRAHETLDGFLSSKRSPRWRSRMSSARAAAGCSHSAISGRSPIRPPHSIR